MAWTTPLNYYGGQVITAAILNQQLRDNQNYLDAGLPVPGMMVAHGLSGTAFPSGWTEDTTRRDRVSIGAGSSYAVGTTGGTATSGTSAAHSSHSITQFSAHSNHSVSQPLDHSNAGVYAQTGSDPSWHDVSDHAGMALNSHSAHTGMSLSAHSAHGSVSILPPYHARHILVVGTPSATWTEPITWVTGGTPSAAQLNSHIRDNFEYLGERRMPEGGVLYWGSSVATVPTRYQYANGVGGVPNLKDSFVIGAGGSLEAGATGGSATATIPPHDVHTYDSPNNHSSHVATQANTHTGTSAPADAGSGSSLKLFSSRSHSGFAVSAHSDHGIILGVVDPAPHTHSAISVLPPYHALVAMVHTTALLSYTQKTWATGDIVSASDFTEYVRNVLNELRKHEVPVGAILEWQNSLDSIPANYSICDGSSGTPDLRDKMVMAAGDNYAPGATGGASSVTPAAHSNHSLSANDHSAHSVTSTDEHNDGEMAGSPGILVSRVIHTHPDSTYSHNAHSGGAASAHNAHSSIPTLPPYKAYAYIKRIS